MSRKVSYCGCCGAQDSMCSCAEIYQLREENSRYREALERIAGDSQADAILAPKTWDAWQALHPEPEYVEEEVVRWMVTTPHHGEFAMKSKQEAVDLKCHGASEPIELRGTRRVLKPKKVRRREELTNVTYEEIAKITWKEGTRFYAEWEE